MQRRDKPKVGQRLRGGMDAEGHNGDGRDPNHFAFETDARGMVGDGPDAVQLIHDRFFNDFDPADLDDSKKK